MQDHAVHDCAHRMFTNTKTEVTTFVRTMLEIRQTFNIGHVGVSQVRGTAQKFGKYGRQCIQASFGK